ncbi:hypothetical protein Fcan01_15780 [Folsomia candida]|uniref:C-type lectin domain-containing protein n=1 Tax=Folsomia candida TaxID=158441 RepID=A0A226DUU0_FOLCA|nr:hypothetical protein Fcan01_15780 [Folsomia candida]
MLRQNQAREKCAELGMKLARIDGTEEINWINDRINTPSTNCDNPWTDGELITDTDSFEWRTNRTSLSTDLHIDSDDNCCVWVDLIGRRLRAIYRNAVASPLCYLETRGDVTRPQNNNIPGLSKNSREDFFQNGKVLIPESQGQSVHAELNYVGTYHGKEFYFGTGYRNQGGTQFLGRVKCAEAGMNFAKIDSPEEIAWLSWLLPPTNYWTDGVQKSSPLRYHWATDQSPLNSELNVTSVALGLALNTFAKLVTYDQNDTQRLIWYLCYQYRLKK